MQKVRDSVQAWLTTHAKRYSRRVELIGATMAALGVSERTVRRALQAMDSQGATPVAERALPMRSVINAWVVENYEHFSSRASLVSALTQKFGIGARYARKVLLGLEQSREIPRLIAGQDQFMAQTKAQRCEAKAKSPYTKVTEDRGSDTLNFTSESTEIQSVEDLLDYFNISLDDWVLERSIINKWDMGYCSGDGEEKCAKTQPLYQIKVWLKRRRHPDPEQVIALVRESLDDFSPEYPKIKRGRSLPDQYMVEVSIPDFHFGSLCWGKETGARYDLDIAKVLFNETVEHFITSIEAHGIKPEMFLFPVGNDFFNVNSMENITAHNTRQDEDDRWQKSFFMGRDLLTGAVDRLVQVAPVRVLVVPGNHDLERIFYMGVVLESHYRLHDEVEVDASPTTRKYLRYGNNLLGFTHGNEEKLSNLPLIMARERPDDWGATQYREMHIGHLHRTQDKAYLGMQEFDSVRVRVMPTLCATNSWATAKGFSHIREAVALVWDKAGGCVIEYKYHTPERLT